jgi:hypothetical protein
MNFARDNGLLVTEACAVPGTLPPGGKP